MLNKTLKALLTMLTGLFLCLVFVACEQSEVASQQPPNKILKRGNGPDPESLDPQLARSESALTIVRDLYEGLLTRNAKGELVAGVAERWVLHPDDQCYRFYLRADAKWSSGDTVTAQDFIRGFQFAVDAQNNSPYANLLKPVHNVAEILSGELSVDAIDVWSNKANELNVCMQGMSPASALELFALPVTYPRHSVDTRLSNGAYQLRERIPSSNVALSKNQNYYAKNSVYFDEVHHIITEDANSELKRFLAKELDITATIPAQDVQRLKVSHTKEVKISQVLNSYFYGFNLGDPPFDNHDIRTALSLVVDRELLVDKVLGAGEQAAWTLIPPLIENYDSFITADQERSLKERLDLAKALYQRAGYSEENPLRFELRYNSSPLHKKIAVALASMWKKHLGAEAELYNEEWKVFLQNRRSGNTQMFRSGWIADINDASNYLQLFTSGHPLNDYQYSDAAFDWHVSELNNSDLEKRKSIIEAAENILLHDSVIIPLYFYVSKHMVAVDINGWEDNVLDIHLSQYLSRTAKK